MCFDAESHPPIEPIAGAAVDGRFVTVETAEGERFAAYRADASRPTGAGILVLPDVRGLYPYYEELALRLAEAGVDAIAVDYFGRTAGIDRRDATFEYMPHVARTTWTGLQADARAAVALLRAERPVRAVFSVGFCLGGRISFLLSTLPDLDLAGVIGFYGWPVGPSRNDTPAPIDEVADVRAPVLGIFGGADPGIPADAVEDFGRALGEAGVEHRIVAYEGAPHSFFDRKQEEFADASAAAWGEVLAFVRSHSVGEGG